MKSMFGTVGFLTWLVSAFLFIDGKTDGQRNVAASLFIASAVLMGSAAIISAIEASIKNKSEQKTETKNLEEVA